MSKTPRTDALWAEWESLLGDGDREAGEDLPEDIWVHARRLEEENERLAEALKSCRHTMIVEDGLHAGYGWAEFVRDVVDPALAQRSKEQGENG